jgi:hypothetical protein
MKGKKLVYGRGRKRCRKAGEATLGIPHEKNLYQ